MRTEDLIHQYETNAVERGECLESGSGKNADKLASKLLTISKQIKKNHEGRELLASLLHHENPYVRNAAALDVIIDPRFTAAALEVLNSNKVMGGFPAMEAITKLMLWEHYKDRLT